MSSSVKPDATPNVSKYTRNQELDDKRQASVKRSGRFNKLGEENKKNADESKGMADGLPYAAAITDDITWL